MPLTRLLYCSEHYYDFNHPSISETINNIIIVSQRSNFKQSISGVLLADDPSFVQILEGEREQVLNLFLTIRQDTRHFNVLLLSVEDIPERRYAAWPMACVQKTLLNTGLFEPYIEKGVFRPDRYRSSEIYALLSGLTERGLKSGFSAPTDREKPKVRPLYKVPLEVCDTACATRLFETEDAAAEFIAALKLSRAGFDLPYVILPDQNRTSKFLIKILVDDAQC